MDLGTVVGVGGVTAVFTAGAAWGAVRNALNGTRERVKRIDEALVKHMDEDRSVKADIKERITRIEATLLAEQRLLQTLPPARPEGTAS